MPTTRKVFLNQAAGAGAALAGAGMLGPPAIAEARRHRRSLTAPETATLAAWCDVIVPGAREAGVGDFVNDQLAKDEADSLLSIRYFGWPPPYDGFYRDGITAVDAASEAANGAGLRSATIEQRITLAGAVIAGTAQWSGPPAFLFYLVTRSDGVDVVYGTASGYARIGYPYAPQVTPRRSW